jgi:amino acid adenylation domain-containing protein/non-ribosomal peptide synthase protein (TIGR01720 family)
MRTPLAERLAGLSDEQRGRLLRRLVQAGRHTDIPAMVVPRPAGEPVRLSPAQEDLWVYESLYPGTAALNLCCAYHFREPVDSGVLAAALTVLQRQHDVLRMRITGTAGDLRVTIAPPAEFALERVDLRHGQLALDEVLTAFSRRAFTVSGGPLIRGQLITVDDTRSTLVLKLHHIITDWWSFDVLHQELSEAYRALRGGAEPAAGRAEIQYADFAFWQRQLEAAGVFDAQLGFWRDYLAELPPPLTVGGTGGHGHGSGPQIGRVPFEIDAQTAAAVRAFARERHATVYGVLMTAFAVLAHRLSGREDLLIGTPTANRSAPALARLVGYVMNTVPVRWRFGPGDTFAGLLGRFMVGFPRALANADVPVGRLITALAPERMPGRSPLVQWVFMHLPGQPSAAALRQIAVPERVHTGGEHDLVGITQETEHGIEASLEFRTDIYPADVVQGWARSFGVLLAGLLARPDEPVISAELLTAAERLRMLGLAGGDGAGPAGRPCSLADLPARWAAATPDAVAVEAGDLALSYAELEARVSRLAGELRGHGAVPGAVVALAFGRPAAMLVAQLAVQRAGAAYLPVDLAYPAARIRFMLADAGPALLVTDDDGARALPDCGVAGLVTDPLAAGSPGTVASRAGASGAGAGHGDPPPALHADPAGPAYLMYTSGSTGRPKGVVVTHEGIAGLAADFARELRLDAASRVLRLASPSFDISVAELCMAFGPGGTLVIPPPGPLVGDALAQVLAGQRISCVLLPPTVLASVPAGEFPALRAVCLGGEACPAELADAWARGRLARNAYGPTEATCAVTISEPLVPHAGPPPIGRPLTGRRTYVLDGRLRPVPAGVTGELYAAGDGLALGYHRQPGATAERFVADPFAARAGARMYRTGDLARIRGDGQLEFAGRADAQVSLHGFRVEPGEIEAVLARHESVARSAVLLREDRPGSQRLVAYVVPAGPAGISGAGVGGAGISEGELAAHAAAALPAYLVPSEYVPVPALPVTAHGKLDLAALAALVPAPAAAAPRAPGTPEEETLCRLLAGLLGTERVGAEDDFLALGGDSITAIQLVSRARAAGLALTPQEVLTARTPERLGRIARPVAAAAGDPDDQGEGLIPLTPLMRWWRDQGGQADAFTQSLLLELPPGLTAGTIAAALRALVARHPVLRSRLLRDAPGGWQLETLPPETLPPETLLPETVLPETVLPEAVPLEAVPPGTVPESKVGLERRDAGGLTDPEIRAAARALAEDTRVDPGAGRMLCGTWYDGGEHRPGHLLLTAHHLVVDAVSWRLLESELTELLASRQPAGPPHGTSFRRWARHQRELAARPERVAELPFWAGTLLAGDARLAPGGPPYGTRAQYTAELDGEVAERVLTTVPAAFRCGPGDVLLTALLAAARRLRGGGAGLLVDLEGHGRDAPADDYDLSAAIGWFTIRYPVLLDAGAAAGPEFWDGGAATGQAVKQVKERLRAVPAGGLGYGLLRYLNAETAATLAPLPEPDVQVNYLGRVTGAGPGGAELIGMPGEALPLTHAVELDVLARAQAGGTTITANWSYAASAIGRQRVTELSDCWFEALGVIAGHAAGAGAGGATSSDFPLVGLTQEQIEALESDLADLSRAEQR